MAANSNKTESSDYHTEWPFGKKNYILFAASLVVIVIGFVTLSQGSMTLSPILLVFGYCVLIPWAIMARGKDDPAETEATDNAE